MRKRQLMFDSCFRDWRSSLWETQGSVQPECYTAQLVTNSQLNWHKLHDRKEKMQIIPQLHIKMFEFLFETFGLWYMSQYLHLFAFSKMISTVRSCLFPTQGNSLTMLVKTSVSQTCMWVHVCQLLGWSFTTACSAAWQARPKSWFAQLFLQWWHTISRVSFSIVSTMASGYRRVKCLLYYFWF